MEEWAPVLAYKRVGYLAPLSGPPDIRRELAGGEHVAAGKDDSIKPVPVAAIGTGHRLVDQRKALLDTPRGHENLTEMAERAQL
jgi:hypothetical protein